MATQTSSAGGAPSGRKQRGHAPATGFLDFRPAPVRCTDALGSLELLHEWIGCFDRRWIGARSDRDRTGWRDYGHQVTRPVCVALNVAAAGQPPSTVGSR